MVDMPAAPKPGDLGDRHKIYGRFSENAHYYQCFMDLKNQSAQSTFDGTMPRFTPVQNNALDLIFLKLSRILSGDPNYMDNWTDLAGYALLVEAEIKGIRR